MNEAQPSGGCRLKQLCTCSETMLTWADRLYCLLALVIRIYMARIYFNSGMSKIQSWSTTVDLFAYEYKPPLLPPEIAAYLATGVELTMPVLLVLGLATRLAVLPMLGMAAVIQYISYTGGIPYLESSINEHWHWMMLLGVLLLKGPGRISVDHFLRRCWLGKQTPKI